MNTFLIRAAQLKLAIPGTAKPLTQTAFSIEVPLNACTILIGRNGAGKSTFLRCLAGEIPPLAGSLSHAFPSDYAFLSQEPTYAAWMPTGEYLRLGLAKELKWFSSLSVAQRQRLAQAAEKFAICDLDRPLGDLSSGERQRVFLARADLQNAAVLFLDEPTNHLDPVGRQQMLQLLQQHFLGKAPVIISTHDIEFARSVGTWFIGFNQGGVCCSNAAADFWNSKGLATVFGPTVGVIAET